MRCWAWSFLVFVVVVVLATVVVVVIVTGSRWCGSLLGCRLWFMCRSSHGHCNNCKQKTNEAEESHLGIKFSFSSRVWVSKGLACWSHRTFKARLKVEAKLVTWLSSERAFILDNRKAHCDSSLPSVIIGTKLSQAILLPPRKAIFTSAGHRMVNKFFFYGFGLTFWWNRSLTTSRRFNEVFVSWKIFISSHQPAKKLVTRGKRQADSPVPWETGKELGRTIVLLNFDSSAPRFVITWVGCDGAQSSRDRRAAELAEQFSIPFPIWCVSLWNTQIEFCAFNLSSSSSTARALGTHELSQSRRASKLNRITRKVVFFGCRRARKG